MASGEDEAEDLPAEGAVEDVVSLDALRAQALSNFCQEALVIAAGALAYEEVAAAHLAVEAGHQEAAGAGRGVAQKSSLLVDCSPRRSTS